MEDGMSHRAAYDMVQDEEGFLWIATRNGLNRFDGHNFLVYNNQVGNPNHISNNIVWWLLLTKERELILFNELDNVEILNPQTNQLVPLDLLKPIGVMSGVRAVHQTGTEDIFLITENSEGFYILKYENHSFQLVFQIKEKRLRSPEKMDVSSLRFHFFIHRDGTFWILEQETGLRVFDSTGQLLKQFNAANFEGLQDFSRLPVHLNFMFKDLLDRIWISFNDLPGVYLYNNDNQYFELSSLIPQHSFFSDAHCDENGNILFYNRIVSNKKPNAWLLDSEGQLYDYFDLMDLEHEYNRVYSKDLTELFFQLTNGGVSKIHFKTTSVKNYLKKDLKKGDFGISTRGIIEDENGNLLIATEREGWFQLDSESKIVQPLRFSNNQNPDLLKPTSSRNFIKDSKGFIWTSAYKEHVLPATPSGYLLKYNSENQEVKVFDCPGRTECLTLSSSGLFWLAGTNNLYYFNPETEQFFRYQNEDGTDPMEKLFPHEIIEDSEQLIWIATDGGLLRIDPMKKNAELLHQQNNKANKRLLQSSILTIHENEKGKLWLGTLGNGILIYDKITEEITNYTEADGLANNNVCSIVSEKEGHFWLGTYNGISYFNSKDETFRNFYVQDGFNFNEFNRLSFYKDSLGQFYFGGMNGFNVFKSEDLLKQDTFHKLFLSAITFYEQIKNEIITQTSHLDKLKKIDLVAENRFLKVQFGINDFSNPELNKYAVFLEDYDQDWRQLGNTNEIIFNNLPAGDYQLHIKGADYKGIWTPEPLVVKVHVKAFFYKTGWFLILCMATFAAIVFGIYKYRLNQIFKMLELRTKIAGDLHDDVGGLLTGIAMQSEILELDESIKDQSRIKKIQEMSQNAIAQMRDLVWSIDGRRDKLEHLFDRMREHAGETLQLKGIGFKINIDETQQSKKLPLEVRQNLFLIFKEAVTNTLRHSNATKMTVSAKFKSGNFEMCIWDNGTNLNSEKISTGLGLSNMKRRAKKMNGMIEFETEEGFGILIGVRV